jgi:hypothetical protein
MPKNPTLRFSGSDNRLFLIHLGMSQTQESVFDCPGKDGHLANKVINVDLLHREQLLACGRYKSANEYPDTWRAGGRRILLRDKCPGD